MEGWKAVGRNELMDGWMDMRKDGRRAERN